MDLSIRAMSDTEALCNCLQYKARHGWATGLKQNLLVMRLMTGERWWGRVSKTARFIFTLIQGEH